METKAANAYRAARARVDRQVAQIQALLTRHASTATTNPASWGNAGDMHHVAEVLNDAIEFLGGRREETTT